MALPKKGVAYIDYITLIDILDPSKFKVNPTIDEGDFQISKDGGAFANLATKPVVTPLGSRTVKLSLSATEMDANNINVQAIDVAGDEWQEVIISYNTQDVVNIASGMLDALSQDHLLPGTIGKVLAELYEITNLDPNYPVEAGPEFKRTDNINIVIESDGRTATGTRQ